MRQVSSEPMLPVRALHGAFRPFQWRFGGLLILGATSLTIHGADWTEYRGPTHDGISTYRITRQWSGSVTNPVWRVPVLNGLSSFAVSGGRAITQVRRTIEGQEMEVCIALDVKDGSELWATTTDIALYDGGVGYDDGPRSTPAVDSNSVYVLTSYLKLFRLNATNGAIIWQKDLVSLYGGYVISWQNAASPLLDNGLLYLNASTGNAALMA